jgi:hypothetical protein
MDVKRTPPPHAATPRIQVSNSLYFTLYFTMHTINASRYSNSTYFNMLPVAPHLLIYCYLVIELLLLLSLFCLYSSVSSLPKFFHGFAVEQLQCAPAHLNTSEKEGRPPKNLSFQLQLQSAPAVHFAGKIRTFSQLQCHAHPMSPGDKFIDQSPSPWDAKSYSPSCRRCKVNSGFKFR